MKKPKILIADDHDGFRDSLVNSPILKKKYNLIGAATVEIALNKFSESNDIDCLVLDYDFKKGNSEGKPLTGIDALNILKETHPFLPIIMMSGITEGRGKVAIDSINIHAMVFLDKPFHPKILLEKLDSIFGNIEISEESADARKILTEAGFDSVSSAMTDVCRDAYKASQNDLNLLIVGETGTGKSYLAEIIHSLSDRKNHIFKQQSCGEISPDVNSFKSQLFGHVKGAFSGSAEKKEGVFELSGEGSLLLDDVTTLTNEAQLGLLQVLDKRKFFRFGDDRNSIEFKARLICTTNENIHLLVKDGKISRRFILPPEN